MRVHSDTVGEVSKHRNFWLLGAYIAGTLTLALAAYQFFLQPLLEPQRTAASIALSTYWPIFALYLSGLGIALVASPKALAEAQTHGNNTVSFSAGCVIAAVAGGAMSLAIGGKGAGGTVIHFYWVGLAILWSGSISMAHLSAKLRKPLAVRDWIVYSYAMLLLPLSFVPGIYLWPVFFELDPHQAMMTAATSSFAGHFVVAHYVIFEILDRRHTEKR